MADFGSKLVADGIIWTHVPGQHLGVRSLLSSSAHPRWFGIALAVSLPIGASDARGTGAAAEPAVTIIGSVPSAGFVEIPDTAADQAVSIEPAFQPRLPVAKSPRAATAPLPAITRQTVLVRPRAAATAAVAKVASPPAVDPMIEGQAPPLAVLISFSKYRPRARSQADALAQTLRSYGVSVEEAAIGGLPVRTPRIGYVFAPDRPAALAISVNAGAQYGFVDPVNIPFTAVPDARPGLIAIELAG